VSVETVLRLARLQATPPSGLTVSGGEPTDQAAGVMELICGFRRMFPDTEVVLYTGLRWPVLAARYPALVTLLDVAVTGPFVRTLEATPLAGSSNQDVRLLTPLADRLYRDWQDWPRHLLQVGSAKADRVVTVGIPHTPRMARAAEDVAAMGATWERINGTKNQRDQEI
jgi:anaerobic ribonucleoside-triphosphate reductase activating protein